MYTMHGEINASDSSTDARIQEFPPVWRAEGLTFGWGEEEEEKGKKKAKAKERWWSRWVFICVCVWGFCAGDGDGWWGERVELPCMHACTHVGTHTQQQARAWTGRSSH